MGYFTLYKGRCGLYLIIKLHAVKLITYTEVWSFAELFLELGIRDLDGYVVEFVTCNKEFGLI